MIDMIPFIKRIYKFPPLPFTGFKVMRKVSDELADAIAQVSFKILHKVWWRMLPKLRQTPCSCVMSYPRSDVAIPRSSIHRVLARHTDGLESIVRITIGAETFRLQFLPLLIK